MDCWTNPYGQHKQVLLDRASELWLFHPDTVLFAGDAADVTAGLADVRTLVEAATWRQRVLDDLARDWRTVKAAFGCRVVQQTFLPRLLPVFGNNEHRLPGSAAWQIVALNMQLRERAEAEGVDLLAVDARAAQDGIGAWHDPILWHRAKQEIHPGAAPLYGDLLARLLAAQRGRSAKCLVLDLDNTVWGGVIGDDGLAGITLGQGSALGEAFVAFQQHVRALSRRGIILAVCSKNDEANALLPFEQHPEMVLRREDIACFVANWTDKAANLRTIADRLNIGRDALVFVDDNPFERAIVRRELPEVAVPEIGDDPAFFAQILSDAGLFEGVRLTDEDLERSAQYRANVERDTLREAATDLDGYLSSLDMRLEWSRFNRVGAARVVQLVNKTNQFNLTTRRTTDAEIAVLIEDAHALTLQLRLLDRFGDNGIIGIVIARPEGGPATLRIDTWLMSCRVLGRGVERATLDLVVAEARRLGATRLIGEYRPTAKNGMVRQHYPALGFRPLGAPDAATWELSLADHLAGPGHIAIVPVSMPDQELP